ncbi:MAG: hypothetical protein ACR2N7_10890 [Acidimicrobiia bacterium]
MADAEDLKSSEETIEIEIVEEEEEAEDSSTDMADMQKLVSFIIGLVLVFWAQRDLRKRDPEMIRGSIRIWKIVAMAPPGAVTYLIIGRRRALAVLMDETPESIAA